jgi:hypothetical protein
MSVRIFLIFSLATSTTLIALPKNEDNGSHLPLTHKLPHKKSFPVPKNSSSKKKNTKQKSFLTKYHQYIIPNLRNSTRCFSCLFRNIYLCNKKRRET